MDNRVSFKSADVYKYMEITVVIKVFTCFIAIREADFTISVELSNIILSGVEKGYKLDV